MTGEVLTDWHTADIDERLRATLGLLEKITFTPREVGTEDVARLRAAGLSDRAILDAAYVCVGFNIITRIANALDFKVPSNEVFSRASRFLMLFGYNLLSGFSARGVYRQVVTLALMNKTATNGRHLFDPYDRKLALLRNAVLSEPGALKPAVRQAISEGRELPDPLGAYVRKVAEHAYSISDEDIAELHSAHYTDDQIFEATISAALGAGLLRLDYIFNAFRPPQH